MERAVSDASARVSDRGSALDSFRKRKQELQERIAGYEKTKEDLELERQKSHVAENVLAEQIEALRGKIEPAESKLDEANANQDSLQSAEAEARQALSAAEHHHAQAKINLAKRQESLDTLRRRIEDDFGLHLNMPTKYLDPPHCPLTVWSKNCLAFPTFHLR
jgi:chromosome segregation protein